MPHARFAHLHPGSSRWLATVQGALAGVVAVIVPMVAFYPLGRLFDPSVGGTPRGSLATELLIGFIGGVIISPIGAGIGALVGHRLRFQRLRRRHHLMIIGLSTLSGVGMFVALNGGLIDERGSIDSLQHVVALSVLAWLVGVVTYSLIRRALAHVVGCSSIRP